MMTAVFITQALNLDLTLILGIDRFVSEARALTNTIGNAVATIVVAHWEGELDRDRLREALASPRESLCDKA